MQWDLFLGEVYIFSYRNNQFKISYEMEEDYLRKRCQNVFGNNKGNNKGYNKVIDNIQESKKQSHGTMLVILAEKNAESEAERLAHIGFGMKNAKPKAKKEVISLLNAIDGSVLLDTEGKIHGIGMILDGDNTVKGNLARGARYNSALKYGSYLKKQGMDGMILIVSEDGSVEIIDTKQENW